jgi:hypothetical protein
MTILGSTSLVGQEQVGAHVGRNSQVPLSRYWENANSRHLHWPLIMLRMGRSGV